jgi:hypothetical protein
MPFYGFWEGHKCPGAFLIFSNPAVNDWVVHESINYRINKSKPYSLKNLPLSRKGAKMLVL